MPGGAVMRSLFNKKLFLGFIILGFSLCSPCSFSKTNKSDEILGRIAHQLQEKQIKGAFIIGGGVAYESISYKNNQANDIDSMFLFATRKDLEDFLTKANKEQIQQLLGYDDKFEFFDKKEVDTFIKDKIQVMRIAGNIQGIKVTVKLSDLETLSQNEVGKPFQVLSLLKDRRVYNGFSLMGDNIEIMLVNKRLAATKPTFIILDRNYYSYKETLVPGLITDFLITAKPVSGEQEKFLALQLAKRQQMIQLAATQGCLRSSQRLTQYLIREFKFSEKYKNSINTQFDALMAKEKVSIPDCSRKAQVGFVVDLNINLFKNPQANFNYIAPQKPPVIIYPDDLSERIKQAVKEIVGKTQFKIIPLSSSEKAYSSNANLGKVTLAPNLTEPVYFYKAMREKDPTSIFYEVKNLENLEQLYPHVIKPVFVDKEYRFLIEPFFAGEPLAQLLKVNFEKNVPLIFKVELSRAEELLTGYVTSLESVNKISTQDSRIHKLYYERLTGERIKSYYFDKQIKLPNGETISFEQLKELTPIINGKTYPSLGQTIEKATENLNPKYLDKKVKIYGFGDNHAGNILVKNDGTYETIDYEYAGVTHPCEDLAKTVYNDVYFEVLFPTMVQSAYHSRVQLDLANKKIIINHNFSLSQHKQALLATKTKGVLEPFFIIAKEKGYDTTEWEQILGSALFAAGFLNKNIFEYPTEDAFIALAVLIEIANNSP